MHQDHCILCQDSDIQVIVPASAIPDKVDVLQCRNCDLVFLESRAKEDELDPEETAYWANEEQKKIYLRENVQKTFAIEFNNRLETLDRLKKKQGTLLDVGCGVGHFLNAAQKHGWAVKGLDISHTASSAAREAYGLEVTVGTLDAHSFEPNEFDVITLWDVIEHIRKPLENVKAANRLLKKGGMLVMKTPNESGLFKQFSLKLYRLFGNAVSFLLKYVYYVPHYFSYSPKTMNALLAQAGFEAAHYEMDDTPQEFAKEKIEVHYKKDPKRHLIVWLLPAARTFAKIFRLNNKMTVYAKKIREVSP